MGKKNVVQKQAPCGQWVSGDNEYDAANKLDSHLRGCSIYACRLEDGRLSIDFDDES